MNKNNFFENLRNLSFIHFLLWIILFVVVVYNVFLPNLDNDSYSLVEYDDTSVTIIDFVSPINMTRDFWLGEASPGISVYSVENHLKVTSDWLGWESENALSFGYSPTMLWLLGPLIFFPNAIAFCIFNSFGLLSVWWQTRPIRCRFGVGLLVFISPIARACYDLGQTALLTGAGLLFLAERSSRGCDKTIWHNGICGTVLWALSAKPPLALTAGAVLLAMRQWRPVLVAVLLFVFTTLAINSKLGPGWVTDYVHLISTHNLTQADPAFTFSHVPKHMANLRGVLHVDFGLMDNVASKLSAAMWVISLLGLVLAGPRLRLTTGGFWSVGLLLYLLFCPHVSSTEIVQIALLIPFCVPATPLTCNLGRGSLFLLMIIPILPLTSPVLTDNRIFLFTALSVLFISIIYFTRLERLYSSRQVP